MWALFAVYQAIHTLIGAAVDATGIPPEKISFPHARRIFCGDLRVMCGE